MKAITLEEFGGPEVMRLAEIETPTPAESEILVRVVNTSINGPDLVQRRGHYPPAPGESEILGLEVAGTVESVGTGVSRFQPGDRVLALVGGGGYAEYCIAHESLTMPMPENLDFDQAACVCESYITAFLNLFLLGEVQDRPAVLIHGGGGGVATAGIQLCKALSPNTTVFVTADGKNLEGVRQQGADHVFDFREQEFAAEIKSLTEGKGVDVILDHIGASYLEPNMKALARAGTLVIIGVNSGIKAELNLGVMMVKRQRIIGSVLRSRPLAERAEIVDRFEQTVLPLFADGRVEPVIGARFPLGDAAEAHRLMESGTHFGKIVLDVGS